MYTAIYTIYALLHWAMNQIWLEQPAASQPIIYASACPSRSAPHTRRPHAMRSVLLFVALSGLCLAADVNYEDLFGGADILTLFGHEDTYSSDHQLFELRRTNIQVAVKKYNYMIAGFCAPWDTEVCNQRHRGLWPELDKLAHWFAEKDTADDGADGAVFGDDVGVALVNLTRSRSIGRLFGVKKLGAVYEIESFLEAETGAKKEGEGEGAQVLTVRYRELAVNSTHPTASGMYAHARAALKRRRAEGFKADSGNQHKVDAKIAWKVLPSVQLPSSFGMQFIDVESLRKKSQDTDEDGAKTSFADKAGDALSTRDPLLGQTDALILHDGRNSWLGKPAARAVNSFADAFAKHQIKAGASRSALPVYVVSQLCVAKRPDGTREWSCMHPDPFGDVTDGPTISLWKAGEQRLIPHLRRPTPFTITQFVQEHGFASGLKVPETEEQDDAQDEREGKDDPLVGQGEEYEV